MGVPLGLLLCPFGPIDFEHFLTFWHKEMFQVHLMLSLTNFWIQPFLQESFCSFSGEWCLRTQNWVPGMLIVYVAMLWCMCVCIQTFTFLVISTSIHTYWKLSVSTNASISIQHYILFFSLSLFLISYFDSTELLDI